MIGQIVTRTFKDQAQKDEVTGANIRFADFFKKVGEDGSIHCCSGKEDGLAVTWTVVFPDASKMGDLKSKFKDYPTPADFAIIKDEHLHMKIDLVFSCAEEDLPILKELNKERDYAQFNHDSFAVADHEGHFGMQ